MRRYRIADIYLNLYAKECYYKKEFQDFLWDERIERTEDSKTVSICIEEMNQNNSVENGTVLLESKQLTVYDEIDKYTIIYHVTNCGVSYVLSKQKKEAHIYVNGNVYNDEILQYAIRDAFFFYMQQYGCIVVHSASFIYKERAWLFSASAGTGKSTHVDLWKKSGYQIEDLNGDLAALYITESNEVMATGLPWCGTSGIYQNKVARLGGIIFLRRSDAVTITPLKQELGSLFLLARCITPNWTQETAGENAKIVENIVKHVPTAILYCTKEPCSAECAKHYIDSTL